MNDQTMLFTPGTLVWNKVYNRIWWPCTVVDPINAPQELQDYMITKKNAIAMVYFERDNKYDIVINKNKLFLYSCPKKMEFVEKGYNLYVKQNKGSKIQSADMVKFINDVISFEREIGGDVNIFKQFEKKNYENPSIVSRKELIKTLFVSSRKIKKKVKDKNEVCSPLEVSLIEEKLKNRRPIHPRK